MTKYLFLFLLAFHVAPAAAGVLDGQPINAAVTNAAFINKNVNDIMPNILGFNSTASGQGSSITSIQAQINGIDSFTGAPSNAAYNATPAWTYTTVGTSTDTVKQRADVLTGLFNGSGALGIANGGTGQVTALAAFNALSPLNTSGSMIYGGSGGSALQLAAGAQYNVLTADGSNNPSWGQVALNQAAAVTGTLGFGNGGTNAVTAAAAFNNLSPMTTLGDIEYEASANTAARLAGNTTTTKKFLTQTGTGSVSAAPAWATIASTDIPATTVTAGSYTSANITVGADGRLTAAANGSGGSASAPTITTFLTSGTYTPPGGANYLEVIIVGGGGGGYGSGVSAGGGGAGGASSFGSIISCDGGNVAGCGITTPACTLSGSTTALLNLGGVEGSCGSAGNSQQGAAGGNSPLGGAGTTSNSGGTAGGGGFPALPNTGSGGGGSGSGTVSTGAGGSGAAGAYADVLVTGTLASSYTVTVGSGGTGGAAGTSGAAGGLGGKGIVIVKQY